MTERDDIERELTQKDKQALISYCLKLYDTNVALTGQIKEHQAMIKRKSAMINDMRQVIVKLRKLKWYQRIFK